MKSMKFDSPSGQLKPNGRPAWEHDKISTMSAPEQRNRSSNSGLMSRSSLMSRIRSRNNRSTELRIIPLLKAAALTGWRRHRPLPGRPDFCWPVQRVALFVDGCFWHAHDCGKNIQPVNNAEFWKEKLEKNKRRDRAINRRLRADGWIVIRIWECVLRERPGPCLQRIRKALESKNAD
jgi:DNA mismatch endonuclease, patch repair protein